MTWSKGQSGNPAGTKPFIERNESYRKILHGKSEELVQKCIDLAMLGDMAAMKMCMDRIHPAYKLVSPPSNVKIDAGDNLMKMGLAVIAAMGAGTISTDQAAEFMSVLSGQSKLVEAEDFSKRLSALEAQHGGTQKE